MASRRRNPAASISIQEVPAGEACSLIESSSYLAFLCPDESDWAEVDGQGFIAERGGRPVGAVLVSDDTVTRHGAPADYELVVIGADDAQAALRLLSRSVLELGGEWVADCVTDHCVALVQHLARRRGWHVRVESKRVPIDLFPVRPEHLLSSQTLVRFARQPLSEIPPEDTELAVEAESLWKRLTPARQRAIVDNAIVTLRDGRDFERYVENLLEAMEGTRGIKVDLDAFREVLCDELTETNLLIADGQVVDWDRDQAELDGKAERYDARHPEAELEIVPVTRFYGLYE